MRRAFCDAMVARAGRSGWIFLTGDLGFMALEPLQAALGGRFVNAGVAEQNMIGVAAGLAREGLEAWAYSIAPFCYARPFEQIRNDVAFHHLPVRLVGNGGGFGYGVQGPTHHAVEDYGVLLTLQGMSAFVPAFDPDVAGAVEAMASLEGPAYLRLGLDEGPKGWDRPAYAPWRQLLAGQGWTVVTIGPLAGTYVAAWRELPEATRPNLWVVSELPLSRHPLPRALLAQLASGPGLCVAEEHVASGGLGAALLLELARTGSVPPLFRHAAVPRQVFETYGSQAYLRRQSGIDADAVLALMAQASGRGS